MAGADAQAQRDAVLGQGVLRERPQRHERRAEPAAGQHRRAAQAQGDGGEPERAADQQRQQRAARVGEHERDEHDPQAGEGERVERRRALAARAQPEQRRHGHRGGQADRVPVAVGRAQPRVELVGVQRAREDLGGQRVTADDDAGQRDAAEHARPAVGERAHEGERRREHRDVGERPVGLDPRVGGLRGPGDRRDREEREGEERAGRRQPAQRAAARGGERRGGDGQAAAGEQHELDLGRAPEQEPALGRERDRGQDRGDAGGQRGVHAEARQRERAVGQRRRAVRRDGVRGHGRGRWGWPRRARRGRAGRPRSAAARARRSPRGGRARRGG